MASTDGSRFVKRAGIILILSSACTKLHLSHSFSGSILKAHQVQGSMRRKDKRSRGGHKLWARRSGERLHAILLRLKPKIPILLSFRLRFEAAGWDGREPLNLEL